MFSVFCNTVHFTEGGMVLLNGSIKFLMYTYHNFFIHSSIADYVGWFHFLVVVNSAAITWICKYGWGMFTGSVEVYEPCYFRFSLFGWLVYLFVCGEPH